jgi:hypothetical protein
VSILWILLPSPVVGYLLIDSVRKIFSEDEKLLLNVFKAQPVTMLAAATALGAVAVWAVSTVTMRLILAF